MKEFIISEAKVDVYKRQAAYNEDGFAKTFTRTVYVADNTASPLKSGIYTVAEGSKRTAPSVVAFSGYEIVIFQMEPGIFYISDFLGGWYDPVSYTHLDVYKRQVLRPLLCMVAVLPTV